MQTWVEINNTSSANLKDFSEFAFKKKFLIEIGNVCFYLIYHKNNFILLFLDNLGLQLHKFLTLLPIKVCKSCPSDQCCNSDRKLVRFISKKLFYLREGKLLDENSDQECKSDAQVHVDTGDL